MNTIYFTLAGTNFYYGDGFLKPDMPVKLVKEPENKYDMEAIRVEMEGLGKIGYVANSPNTVQGESFSAGRLYDRIGDTAEGIVQFILPFGVLCRLNASDTEKSIGFLDKEKTFVPAGMEPKDNRG